MHNEQPIASSGYLQTTSPSKHNHVKQISSNKQEHCMHERVAKSARALPDTARTP